MQTFETSGKPSSRPEIVRNDESAKPAFARA